MARPRHDRHHPTIEAAQSRYRLRQLATWERRFNERREPLNADALAEIRFRIQQFRETFDACTEARGD